MDQIMVNRDTGTQQITQKVTAKTFIYTGIGIAVFFCVTMLIMMVMSYELTEKPALRMNFNYVAEDAGTISSWKLPLEEGDYYCVLTVSGSTHETVTVKILDGEGQIQWSGDVTEAYPTFNARLDPNAVLTISYDGTSDPATVKKHINLTCYTR